MDQDIKCSVAYPGKLIDLNQKKKMKGVLKELKDSHIVLLQETHFGPDDTNTFDELEGFRKYFPKYHARRKGVAILITETVDWEYVHFNGVDEGSSLILIGKLRGQLYTFVNVYNHRHDKHLLDKLTVCLRGIDLGVLVIGGDFNTALNPHLDRTSTVPNLRHAALRKSVERFATSVNVVDVWRMINPKGKGYAYAHGVNKSRLEYIFIQVTSLVQSFSSEL